MAGDVILQVEWVQADDHLIAAYTVQNRAAVNIVVFDRLFLTERSGGRVVEPDRAYVSVNAEHVLRIEKIVPEAPRNMDVEAPELPYVRVLRPGEALQGRAVVSVPVLTTPAYGEPASGTGSDRARTAVFRIGYAKVDDQATAVPVRDLEDVWSVPHGWAAVRQVVLTGPLIEVDLPVIRPLPQRSVFQRMRG